MGNQNTSGIVEEEEKQIPKIGADERKDFQEKADSHDSEADHRVKHAAEVLTNTHFTPKSLEVSGSVNEEAETQTATLPDSTTDHVEPKESIFEENIPELNNDQPCTLKGEKQMSETNSKPKSTTAIDFILESQEDQSTLANEIVETLQVDTKDDPSTITLQNICIAENKKQNECSPFAEEKPTTNETSCVKQTQPFDQETDQFATIDQSDGKKTEVEINEIALKSDPSGVLVQTECSNPVAENDQEDDNSSSIETIHETNHDMEKHILYSSEFSMEIEQGAEIEQNSNDEKPIILDNIEKLNIESISSHKGGHVELKKSPSFDFGLPLDARPGESEQTPLLYNATATRSFSSCSAMRFQNRSVQTEHYEAVEIEEKTIRMERSNSESSSRANLSLNFQNKKENANIDTKVIQDNGSPSRDDCDVISPKESSKRKPRSTFFTTCICCTAAIN